MNLDPFGVLASVDTNWVVLSVVPSTIGFVLFMYGRKRSLTPHLVAGALLMFYPVVATTVTALAIGGAMIGCGFWWAVRSDW